MEGGFFFMEFDVEFRFAKIQNSHLWGGFAEFDVEFRFAKIQNSHLWGRGRGLAEFDVEFRFAKIQNSHLWGGSWNLMVSSDLLKSKIPICVWVFFFSWNLMLSSDLLKSKIPICEGGLTEFDVEFRFAKIQNSHLWGGGVGVHRIRC